MPRMFDILREKFDSPNGETNASIGFPRVIRNLFRIQNKSEDIRQVSKKLIDAVKKKDIDNDEVAREKYELSLRTVEALLEKVNKETFNLHPDEIYKTVDSLTNQLILGDGLLENVAQEYREDNYLSRHITNVCILSLAVGIQMKFNKSRLHILGMATLLCDIGIYSLRSIIAQPRELSDDEFRKVKEHSARGAEIVSRMGSPYNVIKEVIEGHHERINGKGYPSGLKGNAINDYAKIIGLVDTYEAMTHCRPHHQAKMPHQTIREIMGSLRLFFEPAIIKALVDKISIYPVGSFVKLNSGDTAKVISSNSDSPLRPLVLILLDSYGKRIPEFETLDLSKNNSIYIREPVLLNFGNEEEKKEGDEA